MFYDWHILKNIIDLSGCIYVHISANICVYAIIISLSLQWKLCFLIHTVFVLTKMTNFLKSSRFDNVWRAKLLQLYLRVIEWYTHVTESSSFILGFGVVERIFGLHDYNINQPWKMVQLEKGDKNKSFSLNKTWKNVMRSHVSVKNRLVCCMVQSLL